MVKKTTDIKLCILVYNLQLFEEYFCLTADLPAEQPNLIPNNECKTAA